jgi:hypothetical protein
MPREFARSTPMGIVFISTYFEPQIKSFKCIIFTATAFAYKSSEQCVGGARRESDHERHAADEAASASGDVQVSQ